MKKVILILFGVLIAVVGFAQTPTVYDNLFKFKSAELDGGQHAYYYYSGQDTIGPADSIATWGHDTLITTDYLFIGWGGLSAGAYPNKTLADSLVHYNATLFWLWIQLDTTTLRSGSLTGYGGGDADSVGFASIQARFGIDLADAADSTGAVWADSTERIALSGAYYEPYYGQWLYRPFSEPIATAGIINQWRIYSIRVPACGWVKVNIRSNDLLAEMVVVKWRLIAIN